MLPPFPFNLKPNREVGVIQTRYSRPGHLPLAGEEVSSQLLPVLLGQVGLHVKEDVLPLLDVGTHLLNKLCFLPAGMALVPVVRGVGLGEAGALFKTRGRIWKLWALLSYLSISMLLATSVFHLYSLNLRLALCSPCDLGKVL